MPRGTLGGADVAVWQKDKQDAQDLVGGVINSGGDNMSRDLSFWKGNANWEVDNKFIYTALSNGEYLPYIEEIPAYQIQMDFNEVFKDWTNDNNTFYEKEEEAFQLMLTNQFVRVDCYGMTITSMNMIIDILGKYDCPLYDSTIDIRFWTTDIRFDDQE